MKIDTKKILEDLKKKGFSEVWMEYSKLPFYGKISLPSKKGKSHPLYDVIFKIRKSLLEMGFEEVVNPVFIDESEIYKQYGPEAPIILDRIYYLAGLPRPDIGLGEHLKKKIKEKIKEINFTTLQSILREYRKGSIKSEDLIETFRNKLKISENEVIKLIEILKEFFVLQPLPSSLTLRSHMTAAWFSTIKEILEYKDPPLYLFSIDRVFRREQKEDESHLRSYHSASVVVVDKKLSERAGKELTTKILEKIQKNLKTKFSFKFVRKKETSKYYAKNKEWEVYAKFYGKKYEIGTFGFYSPIALARYEIPFPVYNFGMGVERIVQLISGEKDIRKAIYSYRYPKFDDEQIVKWISFIKQPKTRFGKNLEKILIKNIERYKNKKGPFKKIVYEGKKFKIYLVEPDKGKNFAGPATFNRVYIVDGNLISSLRKLKGIYLGRYVDFIVKKICAEIEEGKSGLYKIRWVKGPSDINLYVPEKILRWMEKNNKKIEIGGPVFLDIYVEKYL